MRSKRLSWIVIGAFCLALLLFVVFYQRYALSRVQHDIAEHAKAAEYSLWNYEKINFAYFALATQEHNYASIVITDRLGLEYSEIDGPPPTPVERWLMGLKLIPIYRFEKDIKYAGEKIGTITVIWRCTTIYTYFYVAIFLLLAATVTWLFIRLIFSKQQLESRNAELQQEIVERQRAESALQQARDELEQRVRERTFDLTEANAALPLS